MTRVLVFAPHPDDDVIGCGGSIAKHVAKGNMVGVVYMTSGDIGSLAHSPEEIAAIRETEARQAAKCLGISKVHFFKNFDGYLNFTWDNLVRITTILREFQPNVVYIPHEDDKHRDHRKTCELVAEACEWSSSPRAPVCGQNVWRVGTILCYEVGTPVRDCTYVEDITDFIDIKLRALDFHASQMHNLNYVEAVRSLNRFRGITTGGGNYCECFQVLKATNLFSADIEEGLSTGRGTGRRTADSGRR
jgi:LmbE family N-acetylglucosaminyl deacetylase